MESLIICLRILQRVPRNRKITAKEIQQHLLEDGYQRDIRTIQRLLHMLADAFLLERDEKSKPYGYSWKNGSGGFIASNLTSAESLLLNLSQKYLTNFIPPKIASSLSDYFNQADYDIKYNQKDIKEKSWLSKVRVVSETQPLLPPKLSEEIFETVSEALYSNKYLNIEYENADGKQSKRKVMPLGLAQQGARLYLVVRFEGYDNERTIALHRIKTASISTIGFEYPKDFDLEKYDNDGRFGFGEGKKIRLNFCINKTEGKHLFETPLSEDQEIVEKENHYQISATVIDSKQLTWWLRKFGNDVFNIQKEAIVNLQEIKD